MSADDPEDPLPPEPAISGEQLELLLGSPPPAERCPSCARVKCDPRDCAAASEFRRMNRAKFESLDWSG